MEYRIWSLIMSWLGWQIDYLLFLQNFRDLSHHIFDNFFLTITLFGQIFIPMSIICLIYWCINKKTGFYVLSTYLYGFLVNIFLKTTACIYRPWLLDSRVKPLAQAITGATGYSFPSGHTSEVVTGFGSIAKSFWENKVLRYLCFIIIFFVMLSRNYLGVHTPQDVIVSFLIGVCLIFANEKLLKWVDDGKNRDFILISVVTISCILLTLYVTYKSYPIHYLNGKVLYDPSFIKTDIFIKTGFILGAFYGWCIEKRFVNFSAEIGSIANKIVRFIVGIVIFYTLFNLANNIFVLYLGEKLGYFIGYFSAGLFMTLIYPFFVKLTQK